MKKVILTESDKKQIISEKEQLIIENFAKQFNKIKRTNEVELAENIVLNNSELKMLTNILSINEDSDGNIVDKVVKYAKRGLLTVGMVTALLASPKVSGQEKQAIDNVSKGKDAWDTNAGKPATDVDPSDADLPDDVFRDANGMVVYKQKDENGRYTIYHPASIKTSFTDDDQNTMFGKKDNINKPQQAQQAAPEEDKLPDNVFVNDDGVAVYKEKDENGRWRIYHPASIKTNFTDKDQNTMFGRK